MNVGRRDSCEVRLPAGAVARCERGSELKPNGRVRPSVCSGMAPAWGHATLNKRRRAGSSGGKVRRKYSCLLNPDLFREVLV